MAVSEWPSSFVSSRPNAKVVLGEAGQSPWQACPFGFHGRLGGSWESLAAGPLCLGKPDGACARQRHRLWGRVEMVAVERPRKAWEQEAQAEGTSGNMVACHLTLAPSKRRQPGPRRRLKCHSPCVDPLEVLLALAVVPLVVLSGLFVPVLPGVVVPPGQKEKWRAS